jgi:hypothetical protein
MKASKEYKLWINKIRSVYSSKNGVIRSCFLDNPRMEKKRNNDKKLPKHLKRTIILD